MERGQITNGRPVSLNCDRVWGTLEISILVQSQKVSNIEFFVFFFFCYFWDFEKSLGKIKGKEKVVCANNITNFFFFLKILDSFQSV